MGYHPSYDLCYYSSLYKVIFFFLWAFLLPVLLFVNGIFLYKEKKIYICSNGHLNEKMVSECKVCGCSFVYMRSQTITKPAKVRTK